MHEREAYQEYRKQRAQSIHGLIEQGVGEGRLIPRTLEDITDNLDTFLTYSLNGSMVACGALDIKEGIGVIRSIYVAPEQRGQGVAAALTNQLIARAKNEGLKQVTLNTVSPGIFKSRGFERNGTPKGMVLVL